MLDVVIPTVRAGAARIRRAVELPIPHAFSGLHFLIVVDGPQSIEAHVELKALEDACASRQSGRVVLLSTTPNRHGQWPAGASAARNTGIRHSRAEWVLFLDDDTTPEPELLYAYAEAMQEHIHAPADDGIVFGFAGVTSFEARADSLWALAARCSGMIDPFTSALRYSHPPWSPTANLMLRRSAEGRTAILDEGSEADVEQADATLSAEHMQLLPAPETAPAGTTRRLPWCVFDEKLPRNGGAEDVDICLRATAHDTEGGKEALAGIPVVPAVAPNGVAAEDVDASWWQVCAKHHLVGVPRAVTRHKLWSVRGMLERGLRWGYAGSLLAVKHPQLSRHRPPSIAECALLAAPLAAVASAGAMAHGRPWRVALVAMSCVLLMDVASRLYVLPTRLRRAAYLPPHLRLSLDEPALQLRFGSSACGRAVGLALVHAGPVWWLSLCFQIGELWGKLERPLSCTHLRQLGRVWDFSFGVDEPPPPALLRAETRRRVVELVVSIAGACWLEWCLTSDEAAPTLGARPYSLALFNALMKGAGGV